MKPRWMLVGGGLLFAAVLALVLWLQYAPVEALPPPPLPPEAAPVPVAPSARRPPSAPVPTSPPLTVTPIQPPPPPPPQADQGPSGLAAFPPPGTKKIKRGIIVPEGYELPPGYVRHYQSTDDGRRLPAILMFHPLHTPRGLDGQPIPITPDRIVPPELAPKGMPIQMMVSPDDDQGTQD
ncbi:MAG TPA: hypothetical protein VIG99_22985 [Myxococcaceae bacterium]|jgi:hypothetical protein